jgi:hypothetical protein
MKNNVSDESRVDDPLDIPEVNFRGGERGRYAHRFGEVVRDEELAAEFLTSRGIQAARVEEDRFAKTPDFRLMKEGRLVAYCEVKTFEQDVWLEKMLAHAKPGELAGCARNDPIYNRISNAIHNAARQMDTVNQNHEVLNVLVMVNRDGQAKYRDLVSVVSGQWDPLAGIHDKTRGQFSEGRIRDEKCRIDLYVWLDAIGDDPPRLRGFLFGNFENRVRVCSLFGINAAEVITVG